MIFRMAEGPLAVMEAADLRSRTSVAMGDSVDNARAFTAATERAASLDDEFAWQALDRVKV